MQNSLTRHNIRLHRDDIAWLQETYPSLSASAVIRALIERHRRDIKGRKARPMDAITFAAFHVQESDS